MLDENFIRSVYDQNLRGVFREDKVRAETYKDFFSISSHNEEDLASFTNSATFIFSFFCRGQALHHRYVWPVIYQEKKSRKKSLSVTIWYLLQIFRK